MNFNSIGTNFSWVKSCVNLKNKQLLFKISCFDIDNDYFRSYLLKTRKFSFNIWDNFNFFNFYSWTVSVRKKLLKQKNVPLTFFYKNGSVHFCKICWNLILNYVWKFKIKSATICILNPKSKILIFKCKKWIFQPWSIFSNCSLSKLDT